MSDMIPDILRSLKDHSMKVLEGCHPQFTATHDGTPVFAEAIALSVRLVEKKTFKIHDLLIQLRLLDESPNTQTLASELALMFVDPMSDEVTNTEHRPWHKFLKKENWRVNSSDRCAVNCAAFKEMKKRSRQVTALFSPCMPHGFSNAGKQFDCPSIEIVRKGINGMSRGKVSKARSLFKHLFGELPERSGQVRWFCDYMAVAQMNKIGLVRLKNEFVERCAILKHSEKSSAKLSKHMKNPRFLADALVEGAAVSDAGESLCRITCIMEGDELIVFVGCQLLENFESNFLEMETMNFPSLGQAAKEAAAIVEKELSPCRIAKDIANITMEKAKKEWTEANNDFQASTAARRGQEPQNKRKRRKVNPDHRAIANVGLRGADNTEVLRLEALANEKKGDFDKAKEDFDSASTAFNEETDRFPRKTEEDFINHAKQKCIKPAVDYYKKNFLEPQAGVGTPNYHHLRKIMIAVQVLNPLISIDLGRATYKSKIRDLAEFTGFPELDSDLLEQADREFGLYKHCIDYFKKDDWEQLDGAEDYNAALKKKDDSKTWRDDTSETARRIWEWWRVHHEKFKALSTIVRLVALIQITSANVERVFSQLKLVLETTQDEALSDVIEARLMERINHRAKEKKGKPKPSLDCLLTANCAAFYLQNEISAEDSDDEGDADQEASDDDPVE